MVEKMECAVHGKLRAIDCLVQTGAGWVCRPGQQCKDGGNKNVVCKFWLEGKCAKGDSCSFGHEEGLEAPAPIGARVRPAAGGGKDKGAGKAWAGGGGKDWGSSKGAAGWGGGAAGWGGGKDWGSSKGGWGGGWGGGWDGGMGWGGGGWGGDQDYSQALLNMFMGKGAAAASMALPVFAKGKGKGKGKGGKVQEDDDLFPCAEHGKVRALRFLEDMGDGTYVCKEGSKCRTAEDTGVKRAMCKFFAQGNCAKGEACLFAHSEEEIGMPVAVTEGFDEPMPAIEPSSRSAGREQEAVCVLHGKKRRISCMQEAEDGFGDWVCKPGNECRDATETAAETPCKFYAQGRCAKDDCPFLHDGSAVAQTRSSPSGKLLRPSGGASASGAGWGGKATAFTWGPEPQAEAVWQGTCSLHGKTRKSTYLVEAGNGEWVCAPGCECQGADGGGGGVKRSMCKFFLQGACAKGESCTFAHDASQIGEAMPASGEPAFWPAAAQGGWRGGGGGAGGGDARPPEARTTCALHGKTRSVTCLQDAGDGSGAYVCRPGMECRGADGAPEASETPCRFWAQGRCAKGEACPFQHTGGFAPARGGGVFSHAIGARRSSPY